VKAILDVVCRITGMGFAAVARVAIDRCIACHVLDDIAFGLVPGGGLEVGTTRSRRSPSCATSSSPFSATTRRRLTVPAPLARQVPT